MVESLWLWSFFCRISGLALDRARSYFLSSYGNCSSNDEVHVVLIPAYPQSRNYKSGEPAVLRLSLVPRYTILYRGLLNVRPFLYRGLALGGSTVDRDLKTTSCLCRDLISTVHK